MPVYNYTGTWRREPQSGSPHSGNPQSGDRDSPSDAFGRTPDLLSQRFFPKGSLWDKTAASDRSAITAIQNLFCESDYSFLF
jgi:hypothetical protein